MREHIVEGPFAAGRASTSSIVSGVSYTRTAMMHDEGPATESPDRIRTHDRFPERDEVQTLGEIVGSSAPGVPGLL
jgi:hypothetical protein